MGEPRKQFTFYRSYYDAIQGLPKKDRSAIILAICAYAIYETEPVGLSAAASTAFELIRPTLDSARMKADSGKQGGSKPKANRKQTEREKEGEKEREGEKENECYIMAQTVVCLPLNDGTEFPVTDTIVSEFSALYPAVDVEQALRNMRGWLLNNPKNRKTASGIRRFMNSWLSREQDRARPDRGQQPTYTHGADRLAAMIEGGAFDD